MKSKITRRQLAGAMLVTAAAAQSPPQASPEAPSNAAAELEAARAQNQRTRDALAKVQVPIDAEPAVHFTA